MQTCFRLYTEDKNKTWIEEIMARQFDNFTIYRARGYWKGGHELSIVIEVISSPECTEEIVRMKLAILAQVIKDHNKQQAVLITEAIVHVVMV